MSSLLINLPSSIIIFEIQSTHLDLNLSFNYYSCNNIVLSLFVQVIPWLEHNGQVQESHQSQPDPQVAQESHQEAIQQDPDQDEGGKNFTNFIYRL